MDHADMADVEIERSRYFAIAAIRAAGIGPRATGHCLNVKCEAALPVDRRWCDADCRDAWQLQRNKR